MYTEHEGKLQFNNLQTVTLNKVSTYIMKKGLLIGNVPQKLKEKLTRIHYSLARVQIHTNRPKYIEFWLTCIFKFFVERYQVTPFFISFKKIFIKDHH